MIIDNEIRTSLKIYKEGSIKNIRILRLKNPRIFPYIFETEITNGLGYRPVRKSMRESKSHTPQGLMRHLGNMDHYALFRDNVIQRVFAAEHLRALVDLEEEYLRYDTRVNEELKNLLEDVKEAIHNSFEEIRKEYSSKSDSVKESFLEKLFSGKRKKSKL